MIKSYSEMSLKDYYELRKIFDEDLEDIDLQIKVIAFINDMEENEVLNLPLDKYAKMVESIEFLTELPKPKNKVKTHSFNINGHKYRLMTDVSKMTAGQFIDYQTYLNNGLNYEYIMSCLFIPTSAKVYGDGYDVADVINDILCLDIQTCIDVCFFFQKKYLTSIKHSLIYSALTITRILRKVPKEKKEELMNLRKQIFQKVSEINGIGNTLLI